MSTDEDLVAWVRPKIEAGLERWRALEAAYAPNVEREGEVLWHQAQEHAARHEAELAILDEHYILHREDRSEVYEEFSVTPHPGAEGCDYGCVTCHYRGMGSVWGKGYCRTVRLLASGYRNRPRYAAQWAP